MSFLLSLFLLSWFPARLVACHFHCSRFPLRSVSTTWAFAKLGFCCTWSPLHWGQVEVVSARLDLSHETKYFGGICNFFSSISPQQRFEIADQCYSSVLFCLQTKVHPQGLRAGQPQRRGINLSWLPPFIHFVSSPSRRPSLPYANWASQERGIFVSPEVLTPKWDILCCISVGFSLFLSFQFSLVQSLSRDWLFVTPWIAARQASLSITDSQSSLKLTSIESVMPSSQSHPLSSPFPPAPNPS